MVKDGKRGLVIIKGKLDKFLVEMVEMVEMVEIVEIVEKFPHESGSTSPPFCEKTFRRKDKLTKHLKTEHEPNKE